MTNLATISNQRRYPRIDLDLPVRFFETQDEPSAARLINISLGGAAILGGQRPQIGSKIVAYVDNLDRFQGTVVRLFGRGFGIQFAMSDRKRERLADALTIVANRHALGAHLDRRKYARTQSTGKAVECAFENGEIVKCKITDCSIVGASLETDVRPFIGTKLTLGQTNAVVVRHTSIGFAVEFEEYWNNRPTGEVYAVH